MGNSSLAPGPNGAGLCVDGRRPHLRVHAINIYVRDQDQSLRFYLDQLGFDLAFDARLQSGDRWVAVAPPDGTALLALVAPEPDAYEYKLIGRHTGVVYVTEDVVAKYEEWRRHGVHFLFTPRLRRVRYERQGPPLRSALPSPGQSTTPAIGPAGQPPVWGG